MNKRIKKKYRPIKALEEQLLAIKVMIGITNNGQSRLYNRVGQMEKLVTRNTQATNNRFDKLEKELEEVKAENKKLRKELKTKRSWFGRN